MSIFRSPIPDNISTQLKYRQEALLKKTPEAIKYLNTRAAWVKMTSAVDVDGSPELAKNNILLGGILFNNNLRAGVGNAMDTAYTQTSQKGYRPMPGITGVDIKTKSAYGSLMEATISFKCWDIEQLEDLEVLYMRPNYSVLLEWGWSPYLNNNGKVDTTISFTKEVENKTATKEQIWKTIQDKASKDGNYGAIYGFVKNYSWAARPDGGYDCSTTLITMGELIESLKINYVATDTQVADKGQLGWYAQSPEDFNKDGAVNKSYQKGLLAGMMHETFLLGKQSLTDKTSGIVNLGTKSYALFRFDVKKEGEEAAADDDSFVNDIENIYITLFDFVDLFNSHITIQDKKAKKPLAELSLKGGDHHAANADGSKDLLCLGNVYQTSINPMVCLIKNTAYSDLATIGLADEAGKLKAITTIATALVYNYFYANDYKNLQYGIIGNIYVNVKHIYTLLTDDALASQDKKEKKDISLFDFFKNLMADINQAIGNVANFDIHVDPTDSITRIIDVNYVDTTSREDAWKAIEKVPIQVQGLKSTARSYKLESQIFPEQSSVVAIGAQAKGGALGSGDNTLIDFNQNLTDRIVPQKDVSDLITGKTDNSSTKTDNNKASLEAILEYSSALEESETLQFFSLGFGGNATFDASKASTYANALKDMIKTYQTNLTDDNNNNRAIIPTKLSITLDGIGGLIIGNLFTIPPELLPRGYKGDGVGTKIGYLITGLSHSITDSQDWTTTIDAQFIIMDKNPSRKGGNSTDALKKAARKIQRAAKAVREETPVEKEETPEKKVTKPSETNTDTPKPKKSGSCKTLYNAINEKVAPGVAARIKEYSWAAVKNTFPIVNGPIKCLSVGTIYDGDASQFAYKFKTRKHNNKSRAKIKYIVLHYTAGRSGDCASYKSVYPFGGGKDPLSPHRYWDNLDKSVSADFVVDKSGYMAGVRNYKTIESFHYGSTTWNGSYDQSHDSVGIEIVGIGNGSYCKEKDCFVDSYNAVMPDDYVCLTKPYRGIGIWEKISPVQLSAVANLILALWNDGAIDSNYKVEFAKNITGTSRYNILFPESPLKTQPAPGIITHGAGSKKSKIDVHPQNNLIQMLDDLPNYLGKTKTSFNWVKSY
jgi:hypothetical protein